MTRASRRPPPGPQSSELQLLREELRLRLHLASKEASRQWERIEEALLLLERQLEHGDAAARDAGTEVALIIARVFNDFMLRQLPESGPGSAPVHDAMRKRIYTCTPGDTLARVAQVMWEKDVGCLPVVDQVRKALAMITDRDICMAAFMQWVHPVDSRVQSAMSSCLFTCSPDDALSDAAEAMRTNQVRRLPVVDRDGILVGLITLGDIARYVRLHTPRGASTTTDTQVARTFAEICEPRFRSIPPPPPPGREAPR